MSTPREAGHDYYDCLDGMPCTVCGPKPGTDGELLVRIAKRIHEAYCERANCDEYCKGEYKYETANDVAALARAAKGDAPCPTCGKMGDFSTFVGPAVEKIVWENYPPPYDVRSRQKARSKNA